MECNIHTFVEVKDTSNNKWNIVTGAKPFNWRNYSMFAFLADVRNEVGCEPLSSPRGLPKDISEEIKKEYTKQHFHSASFFTLKEFLDFNYNKTFYNKREKEITTYKENLKRAFFIDLSMLRKLDNPENVRVVFWFDN